MHDNENLGLTITALQAGETYHYYFSLGDSRAGWEEIGGETLAAYDSLKAKLYPLYLAPSNKAARYKLALTPAELKHLGGAAEWAAENIADHLYFEPREGRAQEARSLRGLADKLAKLVGGEG
jgi:hypothetical protein